MTKRIKLAIGVPAYGRTIAADHASMWLDFGLALASQQDLHAIRDEVPMIVPNVCGVERARNLMLAHAMERGCDWLLMIDADTWVAEPGRLLTMITLADQLGCAIVGAAVRKKGGGINWTSLAADNRHQLPKTELYEINSIGAAVMAVNLHKIGEAMFAFTNGLSEDLEFCRQVREAGGKIMIDGRIKTFHLDRAPVLSLW